MGRLCVLCASAVKKRGIIVRNAKGRVRIHCVTAVKK